MKVFVAYDGSDGARRAVRDVLPLVRASAAELVLLHVLDPRLEGSHLRASRSAEALRSAMADHDTEARDFVTGLYDGARVLVELQQRGEDPGEAIARIAGAEGADLVVVATRRAGGLAGFFLGSVTQQVIRQAPCPVMLVRV